MTTTQQQSLRSIHEAQCAERIRARELVRAGEAEPDVVVLHQIAEQIRACCGINALKAHRRAWGWTVERAVERFHAMCVDQGLGARGLVARSWQGWEAGTYSPNDDYRDLLCRLFQTSAVRLGFASDHTPHEVAAAGRVRATPEPASAALVGDVNTGPHHQPDLAGLADEQAGAVLRAFVLAVGAAGLLAGGDQAVKRCRCAEGGRAAGGGGVDRAGGVRAAYRVPDEQTCVR